jgi:hypothetical protein
MKTKPPPLLHGPHKWTTLLVLFLALIALVIWAISSDPVPALSAWAASAAALVALYVSSRQESLHSRRDQREAEKQTRISQARMLPALQRVDDVLAPLNEFYNRGTLEEAERAQRLQQVREVLSSQLEVLQDVIRDIGRAETDFALRAATVAGELERCIVDIERYFHAVDAAGKGQPHRSTGEVFHWLTNYRYELLQSFLAEVVFNAQLVRDAETQKLTNETLNQQIARRQESA